MIKRVLTTVLVALTLTACATDSGYRERYGARDGYYDDSRGVPSCTRCGIVDRIERYSGDVNTSGAGAVTGAIVAGAIGSQIGSGDGRRAATIAGAVAGGIAGNAIEREARDGAYDLYISMDDGRRVVVTQRELNGIREGSRVEILGGRARLL